MRITLFSPCCESRESKFELQTMAQNSFKSFDKHDKQHNDEGDDNDGDDKVVRKIRNFADIQRLKLHKLMKNPNKPVIIPELTKSNKTLKAPEFVRNVMGSSAGAGSGEFHVYRHLRRKEYARQKQIVEHAKKEELDNEFEQRMQLQRLEAEDRTAKNRTKRLKKKEKFKNKKKVKSEPMASEEIDNVESTKL